MQESESVPARLAPKGIDVKEAYQTFRTDPTDSFNLIAGALGTNRLRHLNVSLAWCSRVRCVSVVRGRIRGFQAPLRRSWFAPKINHRTRSAPSFISWACPVDLSKRDWKSDPPCSQAILMADFMLSARTINLDDRRSSWVRKLIERDVTVELGSPLTLFNQE